MKAAKPKIKSYSLQTFIRILIVCLLQTDFFVIIIFHTYQSSSIALFLVVYLAFAGHSMLAVTKHEQRSRGILFVMISLLSIK